MSDAYTLPRMSSESRMDQLKRVARIIGDNFGIDVVFQGNQALTDGKTIVLPSLPENAPDDLVEAIIGFVDHEVGHIVHTDFDGAWKIFKTEKNKRLKPMSNAIEDIRQEFAMCETFRGMGYNLERSMVWALQKADKNWSDVTPFFKLTVMMMLRSKAHLGIPFAQEFYDKRVDVLRPFIEKPEVEEIGRASCRERVL